MLIAAMFTLILASLIFLDKIVLVHAELLMEEFDMSVKCKAALTVTSFVWAPIA